MSTDGFYDAWEDNDMEARVIRLSEQVDLLQKESMAAQQRLEELEGEYKRRVDRQLSNLQRASQDGQQRLTSLEGEVADLHTQMTKLSMGQRAGQAKKGPSQPNKQSEAHQPRAHPATACKKKFMKGDRILITRDDKYALRKGSIIGARLAGSIPYWDICLDPKGPGHSKQYIFKTATGFKLLRRASPQSPES